MSLKDLSKKEKKSGRLTAAQRSAGGRLTPDGKMRLMWKNRGRMTCPNCGCMKMEKRPSRPAVKEHGHTKAGTGKRSGLFCWNCGWLSRRK